MSAPPEGGAIISCGSFCPPACIATGLRAIARAPIATARSALPSTIFPLACARSLGDFGHFPARERQRTPDHPLDITKIGTFGRIAERDRGTVCPGARRAADTVDIGFRLVRKLVIHD